MPQMCHVWTAPGWRVKNFDGRKGMDQPGGGDIVTGRAVAPGVRPSTMALEPRRHPRAQVFGFTPMWSCP
jgi:hypothetical protein